jgi:molybdenum storage protein
MSVVCRSNGINLTRALAGSVGTIITARWGRHGCTPNQIKHVTPPLARQIDSESRVGRRTSVRSSPALAAGRAGSAAPHHGSRRGRDLPLWTNWAISREHRLLILTGAVQARHVYSVGPDPACRSQSPASRNRGRPERPSSLLLAPEASPYLEHPTIASQLAIHLMAHRAVSAAPSSVSSPQIPTSATPAPGRHRSVLLPTRSARSGQIVEDVDGGHPRHPADPMEKGAPGEPAPPIREARGTLLPDCAPEVTATAAASTTCRSERTRAGSPHRRATRPACWQIVHTGAANPKLKMTYDAMSVHFFGSPMLWQITRTRASVTYANPALHSHYFRKRRHTLSDLDSVT